MDGRSLELRLSDSDGRGSRRVTLDLASLATSEVDAKLMQRVGLGGAYSEPVLADVSAGQGAARPRACAPATGCSPSTAAPSSTRRRSTRRPATAARAARRCRCSGASSAAASAST